MTLALLSTEAQLLLAAGRDDEAGADHLRSLLRGPLNWDVVFWLVTQEKAGPVLLRRLTALPDVAVPPDRLAKLRQLAMVVEFRMLHVKQRVDETVDVLARAGIEGVLLKGAALAYTLYPSFAERPMGDIDLLVAQDRALEARTILLQAGWSWNAERWRDENYRDHHHLPPMDDARGGVVKLELHTELFIGGNPFNLSGEVIRRDARLVAVGPRLVRVPSLLHELLHACVHFAWSHTMRSGSWRAFRDVAVLTRSPELDWNAFVADARANRAETCCFWTLRLARDLMGAPVPAPVLAALRPPLPELALRRLEQHFAHQLFPTEASCPSVAVEKLMWGAGVMPRWSGHGRSRPWDEADSLLEKKMGAAPVTGSSKLVRHVKNLQRWTRYVRAVLAPAVSK
jgi:hypothetical protein